MLKLASIFSDHCVLQRDKIIRVFGIADKDTIVEAYILSEGSTIAVGETKSEAISGRFEIKLPELKAATGLKLKVNTAKDECIFEDIAIGEVWLAGGQSNMEYELQNATGGKEILANGSTSLVRFYYTPKLAFADEHYDSIHENTKWQLFDKKASANWSAVGFWYAKELSERLNVTVGVIGCNWGGTVAFNWISRDYLLNNDDTKEYVTDYENSDNFKLSFEEQLSSFKAYEKRMAEWEIKSAKIYEKEPMIPFDEVQQRICVCEYPGPMNECNFTRPYGLYNTMISKIVPYSLGGVIYYQGESDDIRADKYDSLLSLLIKQWRDDFKDNKLPFIIVGLPMHRYLHDADNKSWCIIRANQKKVSAMDENVYFAECIDCGEFHQIHPVEKRKVSHRLFLQAMSNVYKSNDSEASRESYIEDISKNDEGVIITLPNPVDIRVDKEGIDNYISCLNAHPDEIKDMHIDIETAYEAILNSQGFEISDMSGEYYLADKVLIKDNIINVSSTMVKEPQKIRYLWKNYFPVFIFSQEGLPLSPFNIDIG